MVASRPAATVVVGRRDEMGADQSVRGHPTDREASGQEPEHTCPGADTQTFQCCPEPARRRRRGRDGFGCPVGSQSEVGRPVAHEHGHQWYDGQRGARHDERGPAPTVLGGDGRDDGQEDQLTGRAGRGEHAGDQPAALFEPAARDGRHESHRDRPGADADQYAPQQHQLPACGHQGTDRGAGCDQQQRHRQYGADPEAVHQCGGKGRGQSVQHHVGQNAV